MPSAAVPLSLLAKGMFCISLPFFLCEFYEVVPFFSFICWFWENFLSFFTSAVSVLGIIYNLKAVTKRMTLKKKSISLGFEWQNWVRVYNRYNAYVCFIVMDSFEIFKSLILQPKGDRYGISQNIFTAAGSSEYTAQSVRRCLLLMFRLGLLSELLLLFITGPIGLLFTTPWLLQLPCTFLVCRRKLGLRSSIC